MSVLLLGRTPGIARVEPNLDLPFFVEDNPGRYLVRLDTRGLPREAALDLVVRVALVRPELVNPEDRAAFGDIVGMPGDLARYALKLPGAQTAIIDAPAVVSTGGVLVCALRLIYSPPANASRPVRFAVPWTAVAIT